MSSLISRRSIRDTYISSGANANANFGAASTMIIGTVFAIGVSVFNRALIQFDLSGIDPSLSIESARLTLAHEVPVFTGTQNWSAYLLSRRNWSESGATYNSYGAGAWTAPGGDYSLTNGVTASLSSASSDLVLTGLGPMVAAALAANYDTLDLIVIGPEVPGASNYFEAHSRDIVGTSLKPLLEITASLPTPALSVVDNADGTGAVASIAGSASGTTNTIWVAGDGLGFAIAGNRTGNGTVALSLPVGVYWGYVASTNGTELERSDLVRFAVTDGVHDPVVERIAKVIAQRLAQISVAGGYSFDAVVDRPERMGANYSPVDKQVVLTQGRRTASPQHSTEGGPGGLLKAWQQEFVIVPFAVRSDRSTASVDELINQREADAMRAITTPLAPGDDWMTMDGLSFLADFGEPDTYYLKEQPVGSIISLLVTYRHPENDPFTVG